MKQADHGPAPQADAPPAARPRAGFGGRAVLPRHAANDNAPSLLWLTGQAARWLFVAGAGAALLYAVFG